MVIDLRSHFHGVLPTKGLPLQQERDHEEEGSLGSAEEEDKALHEILHHFDLDEDGQLSFSEFEAWFIILFPFSVHDHDHDHDEDHDHDHDHDHDEEASHAHEEEPHEVAVSRRRVAPLTREQASRALPITLSSYTATQTKRQQEPEEEEGHADCHTAEEVFHLYDFNENEALNETEIHAACPLLLMMVTEGCYSEEEGHDGGSKCSEPDAWQAWLATLGSVCILSLLALVGIVLLFLVSANQQIRHYVMMAMVSFAVGALVADAVLHLIPHALEVHSHEEGEGHDHGGHALEEEEEEDKEYLAVATMVLIGVLVFFMTEKLLLVVLGHDGHSHTLTVDEELDRPALEDDDGEDSSSSSSSADMEMAEVKCEPDKPCDVCSGDVKGDGGRGRGFVSRQAKQMRKVKAFGWLNLLADGLHNLIDGVALGAAYSQSLTLGFSTTLAVAFHEIPQELGDYVILLRAGFNQYTALFWNFLSACLSIIGAFIGLAVGQSSTDGEKWILAFTAGGFLYIALADMVPELNKDRAPSSDSSSSAGQRGADWWAVLLQLAGILLGFGILAILAVWEEDIISC
ncbi:ZIP family metal transporter [Balamuthia mandrillaris]